MTKIFDKIMQWDTCLDISHKHFFIARKKTFSHKLQDMSRNVALLKQVMKKDMFIFVIKHQKYLDLIFIFILMFYIYELICFAAVMVSTFYIMKITLI